MLRGLGKHLRYRSASYLAWGCPQIRPSGIVTALERRTYSSAGTEVVPASTSIPATTTPDTKTRTVKPTFSPFPEEFTPSEPIAMHGSQKTPALVRGTNESSPIAPFNARLAAILKDITRTERFSKVEERAAYAFIGICKDTIALKLSPDRSTYEHSLAICIRMDYRSLFVHLHQEMFDAGFPPTLSTYTSLMLPLKSTGNIWWTYTLLSLMHAQGIPPSREISEILISIRLHKPIERRTQASGKRPPTYSLPPRAVEHALADLFDMLSRSSDAPATPSNALIDDVIHALAFHNEVDAALEVLAKATGPSTALGPPALHALLAACARTGHIPGIKIVWDLLVVQGKQAPTIALCNQLLMAAARAGSIPLATTLIQYLHITSPTPVPASATHFACLLEAHARSDDDLGVLRIYAHMKAHNMGSRTESRGSDPRYLLPWKTKVARSTGRLSSTFAILQEAAMEEPGSVPEEMLIALVEAAVELGDARKGMEIWRAAPSILERNISSPEFYNATLRLAQMMQDLPITEALLRDMAVQNVHASVETYSIALATALLYTGSTWTTAFEYMQAIRNSGSVPSRAMYISLLERCIQERDARVGPLLDEMASLRYAIPKYLTDEVYL